MKEKLNKFFSKRRTTLSRVFVAAGWVVLGVIIILSINHYYLGLGFKDLLKDSDNFATSIKLLLLSFPVAAYFWFIRDRDKQRALFQGDYYNALNNLSSSEC